jgi:hypothetical protein
VGSVQRWRMRVSRSRSWFSGVQLSRLRRTSSFYRGGTRWVARWTSVPLQAQAQAPTTLTRAGGIRDPGDLYACGDLRLRSRREGMEAERGTSRLSSWWYEVLLMVNTDAICRNQIEGSLFVVKRSFGCRFRLVVLNRMTPQDLEQVGARSGLRG